MKLVRLSRRRAQEDAARQVKCSTTSAWAGRWCRRSAAPWNARQRELSAGPGAGQMRLAWAWCSTSATNSASRKADAAGDPLRIRRATRGIVTVDADDHATASSFALLNASGFGVLKAQAGRPRRCSRRAGRAGQADRGATEPVRLSAGTADGSGRAYIRKKIWFRF